jgi:hypothetical protein
MLLAASIISASIISIYFAGCLDHFHLLSFTGTAIGRRKYGRDRWDCRLADTNADAGTIH